MEPLAESPSVIKSVLLNFSFVLTAKMDTTVARLAVVNLTLFGSLSGNLLNPF